MSGHQESNDERLGLDPSVVLSIAGSDSGGGAGISADILSITACGGHATIAVTAVTAQNTQVVDAVFALDATEIAAQISSVANDFTIASAKSGYLGSTDAIDVVETYADAFGFLVVDPVLVTGRGTPMFGDAVVDRYRSFLRSASVVTPNVSEAELIAEVTCDSVSACERAAIAIATSSGVDVVVTGFLDGRDAVDVHASGGEVRRIVRAQVETKNVHGTGCSFSSALATYLARGFDTNSAIEQAGDYVAAAIRGSARWDLGAGSGPIDHLAQCDLGRSSAIL